MTETVSIRPLESADAEEMAVVLAHPDLYLFTGGEPPSRPDLERRYALQVHGRSPDGSEIWINRVVVAPDGERAVGYVQATLPVCGSHAEIAWVIGRAWQGRGYATQAALRLVGDLRDRGVRQIVAHIHPEHTASQGVARRLGLRPTKIMEDGETRWTGDLAG
ncbi:GNAT family N-acetyltransferase [Terrabacter sp. NPDC000476]|uniref:GNAT family N-acetyltransferase n=1 Tax=Terrabacter sp. NPDC000476 TaxID=3154258 RepID=UPI0033346691